MWSGQLCSCEGGHFTVTLVKHCHCQVEPPPWAHTRQIRDSSGTSFAKHAGCGVWTNALGPAVVVR